MVCGNCLIKGACATEAMTERFIYFSFIIALGVISSYVTVINYANRSGWEVQFTLS